jgi:Transposase-associated domain
MYNRLDEHKRPRPAFANGVLEFLRRAKELPEYTKNKGKIRCPCSTCNNARYQNEFDLKSHLIKKGFCPNYYDWVCHGEDFPVEDRIPTTSDNNPYRDMVNDALRDGINEIYEDALNAEIVDERPNPQIRAFFDMLKKSEEPVYEGSNVSILQAASRLLTLKCEYNLSHRCVDGISSLIRDIIPENNTMSSNFYETKKLLKALQLPYRKLTAVAKGVCYFGTKMTTLISAVNAIWTNTSPIRMQGVNA